MSGRQAMVRWLVGFAILGAAAVPGLAEARWHRVPSVPQGDPSRRIYPSKYYFTLEATDSSKPTPQTATARISIEIE
ncbi:MAG: hypothetical protein ACKOCT_14860 [Alphaproteobacteria bacterium]